MALKKGVGFLIILTEKSCIDEPNSEALKLLSGEIYKSRVRVFKAVR